MNDDELIARLRRTLHERAEGFQPGPGRLPLGAQAPGGEVAGRMGAGEERAAGGMGAGESRSAGEMGAGEGRTAGEMGAGGGRTAEYPARPPTGPVPIFGRGRRRWPPIVGAAAIVAAAAAAVTVLALTGGRHPVTVPPGRQPATEGPAVSRPAPATTTPSVPASLVPKPSPPAVEAVPAGFQPYSVTFVSASDGWALGWAPCASASSDLCAALASTTDGGRSWAATGAPPISIPAGEIAAFGGYPYFEVRFADPRDGWVYTAPGDSRMASTLWSTHDGAATWHQVPVPLQGATIGRLEAAGGQAQMVLYGPCPAGSAGCQGQMEEEILSTPVGSDDWALSPLRPSVGAGPVLSPQMTLWGPSGWIVNNNRTTVSGASLTVGVGWSAWRPPCSSANGPGIVAAWSSHDLVAVCAEGMWGTPDPGTVAGHNWLFRSGDLGHTFKPVGQLPGNQPESVTVPAADGATVVVADGQEGLLGSFDGGRTWSTLEPGVGGAAAGAGAAGGWLFGYVGFTTATQGVAVAYKPAPTLFMTRDGGHSWSPVTF